ncbi:MAG: nicotinic acid mononucleotide adenylyltransferase, partial [Gammaproteobacteria bacterium]|nr:nicotinic acid mononucleotide adenylyltransferase [Gammaproteobacteria bacterium]
HPASAPFTPAEELSALRAQPAGWLVSAALPLLDISATDIRARVQSGLSPRYLLPDAVCSYIRQHRLYRPQA